MKILHRYILIQFLKTFFLCLAGFVFLFLIFDFMDRIDNILSEDVTVGIVLQYFLFKIPMTLNLMLPVAGLVSMLLTFGILSRNSEITAMRAAGIRVLWLAKPVLLTGAIISMFAFTLNETLVPFSQQRVREIYNIDIKQKDKRGGYSGSNLWWREGGQFYSVALFDSRTKSFFGLTQLKIDEKDFSIRYRTDAGKTVWVNKELGWNMEGVTEYDFKDRSNPLVTRQSRLALPIAKQPKDLFDFASDTETMNLSRIRKFIRQQQENGLPVRAYLADMNEKIAFPFVNFIVLLVSLPFALRPARSGSMAGSFLAGMILAFTYYAVHSFSVAMGRAEMYPPLLSAWLANIVLGVVGIVLNLGAESPA